MPARLVPELDVSDLGRSLSFYVDLIGFSVAYTRPEERFAYLDLAGAELMLEQIGGPGRRFNSAPLVFPYGRGLNLQIEVPNVDAIYDRVRRAGIAPLIALEERWYRVDGTEAGNRQFVVADPDGYLLRPFTDLGARDLTP